MMFFLHLKSLMLRRGLTIAAAVQLTLGPYFTWQQGRWWEFLIFRAAVPKSHYLDFTGMGFLFLPTQPITLERR